MNILSDDFPLILLISGGIIAEYHIERTGVQMDLNQMLQVILGFIMPFVQNHPLFASIIAIMGTFRLFMKPVMEFVKAMISLTPTAKDDAFLAKIEDSKVWKTFWFLIDYFLSIKPTAVLKKQ